MPTRRWISWERASSCYKQRRVAGWVPVPAPSSSSPLYMTLRAIRRSGQSGALGRLLLFHFKTTVFSKHHIQTNNNNKKHRGREGTAASVYRQRRALVSYSCSLPCYESYTKAGYALPQAHSPDVTFALGTECRRSHSFTRVHRPLPPRLTHSDRHPPHTTDAAPPGRAPSGDGATLQWWLPAPYCRVR